MSLVLATGTARARYRPIAEYGAIGEGRSLALVARDGGIDWWSPGRFDAPTVFAAILDAQAGGRFRVGPVAEAKATMRYVGDTNVLETLHETATGTLRVRDMMPFEEDAGVDDSIILRRASVTEGHVEVEVHFEPRFHYGRIFPRFTEGPAGLVASGGGEIMLVRAPVTWTRPWKGARRAVVTLRAGETLDVALRHSPFAAPVPFPRALAAPDALLEERTLVRWSEWSARTRVEGPDAALVRRSALALKLLQYRRNGAFVAAGTTSLPEAIGGVRNWDYRFTWVRDGVLSAAALRELGHDDEARAFVRWLTRTIGDDAASMRIMYTLSGSSELPEREIPHLEGYEKSRPVRIGNAAVHQRQLDVYGELVDFLHGSRASPGDRDAWPLVRSAAEWAVAHWREPDQGIWEMRCEPRNFVLSKAMAWLAIERAIGCARDLGEEVPGTWAQEAAAIREEVLEKGYDARRGCFMQAYEMPALDASNLLLALIGFIDPKDPRMVSTVDRTLEDLTVDGLVYRYLCEDGLPGGEAPFAYCTFWLVEVLAKQGRVREARAIFDRIAALASPLGLYAEEIDPVEGRHLGNYPQAFPHVGLIMAAKALAEAEAATG